MTTIDELFPPPNRRRLSAEEIERAATLDPTNAMNRGGFKAMADRSTDHTDPARPLVEALLAVPAPKPAPALYANPARAGATSGAAGDKRPLTPADIEWLKRLPSEPSEVSAEDVTTLARMVAQAASMSDLRLLSDHFRPIWDHHDVAEQQQERRARRQVAEAAKGGRTRRIEELAVTALSAHVQSEHPELREHEARDRAAERLRARWAETDREIQSQIDAERTWETPQPRPMPGIEGLGDMAAGRERAQRERERREAAGSPFDGLTAS